MYRLILIAAAVGFVVAGTALRPEESSATNLSPEIISDAAVEQVERTVLDGPALPVPDDVVRAYVVRRGTWEETSVRDVEPDGEFIHDGFLFRVVGSVRAIQWVRDVDIEKLEEADRPYDSSNLRYPRGDDVVRMVSSGSVPKHIGHERLYRARDGDHVVFQGREFEVFRSGGQLQVKPTGRLIQKVIANSVSEVNEMVELTIRFEATGGEHRIRGTKNHPFYLPDFGRYEEMVNLKPGDRLQADDGSLAEVVRAELQSAPGTKVYNLEVGKPNNFHVIASSDAGDRTAQTPGVVVHNSAITRFFRGGSKFFKGRQSLGAAASSVRNGLKGLLKDAGLPHSGRVRFVPAKNALNTGIRQAPGGGFIDRFGNVWRRPRGQIVGELHWDVQLSKTGRSHFGWASSSGNHINVSLDGRILH